MIGLQTKAIVALIVITVLSTIAWKLYNDIYDRGAKETMDEIERINDDLENNAVDARDARRRCVTVGGVWDFASVKCK